MTRAEEVEAMVRFVDTLQELSDLEEADRPHVLVATWGSGSGPAMGPFPDLFTAEAHRTVWHEVLNHGRTDDEEIMDVVVMPLFAPGS